MKRLIKLVGVSACSLVMACGGAGTTDTTPKKDTTPKGPATQDKVYKTSDLGLKAEGYKLEGMAFAPQALGRPALPLVRPARRMTLKRAKRAARFKPGKKWPKGSKVDAILTYSSMLWRAKTKTKPAKAKNREVVRELLKKLIAVPHDAKSHNVEVVQQMVEAALLAAGDTAGALKVMDERMKMFPESKGTPFARAWAAFFLLRADKNAEAAALVKAGVPAGRRGEYVKAWVAYRARKFDDARKHIAAAATTWKGRKRRINREAVLILGRAGASVDEADALITKLAGESKRVRYGLLYTLQQVYLLTGSYNNAIKVLDMLSTSVVDPVPVDDLVNFRLAQAGLYYRVNQPGKSVEAAFAAQKGLVPCAAKCDKLKDPVLATLYQLAQVFHTIFASSLDERYHTAAVKLYDAYLAITPPRADKEHATRFYDSLKATKKNTAPGAGIHNNPKALANILSFRREGPKGCYESVLQGDKALAGAVTATIQFDEKGVVNGVETIPAKGVAGLAAVAGCIDAHIRTWTFPSRTVPGKTVVVVPYTFSMKAAKKP